MWMIPQFWLIALATLVSEDLTCIATGVLVAQHKLGLVEGTLACLTGIFLGDILLFAAGRLAGTAGRLSRWIAPEKLAAAAEWIHQRGLKVVIVSRFTPGLRLPTYVAAGLLRSRFWAFTGYFLLASALWTPLLVAGTAAFGEQALRGILKSDGPAWAIALALSLFGLTKLRHFETRRRVVGFLRRKLQWEFWPAWAAYLPLAPYLIYLACKYRSATLFTAANPGMFSGGLVGESKSETLRHLSRVPGAIADFALVPAGGTARVDHFPVVLKPDTGERGAGVSIIRNTHALDQYLASAKTDTILQQYVPGVEFGIYYARYPDEPHGRVLFLTEKRFPRVTGNARHTLRHLILADPRAVCLADAYFAVARRPLESVPAAGEQVQLVEIGSHCRGTVFVDGSRHITPALEAAIDRVSQAHPGFHLGRYDVRAASAEALQRGEFKVIELNGVSAEATHIYDPAVTLREAYRVMRQHWRMAFEIGAINRARGARPMTALELLRLLRAARAPHALPVTHVA